jgi:hypothetical protein
MKSPKPSTESKPAWNWPLVLSVLSLIVSGLAFWYASVAPADLKASLTGDLIVRAVEPDSPVPPGYMTEPMEFLVHVTFANNGAKIGVVQYFIVRLRDESDGTEWLLHPLLVVQEWKATLCWTEVGVSTKKTSSLCRDSILSRFHSIILPGRQTTSQMYLCGYDPGVSKIRPHRFHVTLYTLVSGESDLRPQEAGTLVLTPLHIDAITRSGSVGVQFEEVQTSIRKTFPDTNQWFGPSTASPSQ